MIRKGDKLLVIRYSDFLIKKCMFLHEEILKKYVYVWFGKIGKQKPSQKFIDLTMQQEVPRIILHSSTKDYICEIDAISKEQPEKGYPDYYNELLFNKGNNPSIYFRIKKMVPFDHKYLSCFVVNSSRNELPIALHGSMNSLFFIECIENINEEKQL